MKAYWLLCMFLCVIYSINAQIKSGEAFYSEGAYLESAIAHELAYINAPSDSLLMKKSYAYKARGDYDRALKNLERIQSIDMTYEKALLHFLNEDIEACYNQLLRIQLDNDNVLTEAYHLLFVMTLVKKNDFQEARKYLNGEYSFGMNDDQLNEIISGKLKPKNTDRAFNISLWLPGFGQAYAGYLGRGFVSGLMQTGSAGFTYYSLINNYYFSGVLTGAALFYTFYLGGARYAGQLAEKKNLELQEQILSTLKSEIKKANR
jgi:tetratricopeptide (TPR) repeat protein